MLERLRDHSNPLAPLTIRISATTLVMTLRKKLLAQDSHINTTPDNCAWGCVVRSMLVRLALLAGASARDCNSA